MPAKITTAIAGVARSYNAFRRSPRIAGIFQRKAFGWKHPKTLGLIPDNIQAIHTVQRVHKGKTFCFPHHHQSSGQAVSKHAVSAITETPATLLLIGQPVTGSISWE